MCHMVIIPITFSVDLLDTYHNSVIGGDEKQTPTIHRPVMDHFFQFLNDIDF